MSERITASGDLGRRVAARRETLGLSREGLAERAGIDPGYLAYLEEATASPAGETVQRLATALETSPEELLGGTVDLPPGRGPGAAGASLEKLDPNQCLHLIFPGGVGRVAFDDGGGPTILPVNYVLHDNAVVFRTAADGPFGENLRTGVPGVEFKVAFEVDRIDDPNREGWSVLIRGGAHLVSSPDEQAAVEAAGVQSWAGGTRDLYIKIVPSEVSGRRIRHRP
ncbi:DNA-binding protein [Planomonospora sphaerica]|uniref:DNA-binding protein n=1 Tax=Planomonospora sphaerica TaxID=161355 RepID=A0A171CQI3_9ACTN|nr:pyridoxamine 5'-phosphate oxidase family protein [Planomonospora sphaerica]GAT67068.1 DNA-binding protein [Planomonospora sphaerica]